MKTKMYSKTLKVEKLEEKEVRKEKVETTEYKLTASDPEKLWKVSITSPTEFEGLIPGSVIDIDIGSSQTTIADFKAQAEK